MSQITLTFDNGPCPQTTPSVLEALSVRNIRAYFCLVGRQLKKSDAQADIARETLALGHKLVNHSFSHGVALGDDPSESHAVQEVLEMHHLMHELIGDWGSPWFRPFGKGGALGQHLLSAASIAQLESLGYSMLLWNCVPRDWEDTEGWVHTALEQITEQSHAVLVLHDLPTGAMQHLGEFLDAALESGHTFTLALPEDCVPMSEGKQVWSQQMFDSIQSH